MHSPRKKLRQNQSRNAAELPTAHNLRAKPLWERTVRITVSKETRIPMSLIKNSHCISSYRIGVAFEGGPPVENIAFRMNSDQNSTVLSVSPMAEQTRSIPLRPPRARSLATSLPKKKPNKAGPTTNRNTKTSLSNTFLHLHGSQSPYVPTIKL
jgi:hypothetical protein